MEIVANNDLQSFNFAGMQLRALLKGDEPWFVAMDVARVLAYADAWSLTRRLDSDEVQNLQISGFGNRGASVINESGLYSAILGSNKEEAKAFKKWVTSEVLPAIRKTGSYSPAQQFALPKTFADALRSYATEIEAHAETKAQLEAAQPALRAHDAFLDSERLLHISNVAKAYKAAGIKIGREGMNRTLASLGYVYDAYRGDKPGKHKWRVATDAQRAGVLFEKDDSTEAFSSYQVRFTPRGFFEVYEELADLQGVEKYVPRERLVELVYGE